MIDLYTWPTPNGRKVSIALEEMAAAYSVRPIDITQQQQFDEEFLALSPNNKIPAIYDHEAQRGMMESGAILVYLADKFDRFWGDDRYQTLEWLMLQMGGIGPMLGQAHHFLKFNLGAAPYAEERYRREAKRLYDVLDRRLSQRDFLAGKYSIADMATWPWVSRFEWQQIDLSAYPNVCRWYSEIAARDGVRKGYDVPHHVNEVPMPV